jgi:hypothetical protein
MSNLLHTLVTSPGMVQGPATHSPSAGADAHIGRPDTLTSQHVEVGIVLSAMLGESCAADYLARHDVNASVTQRVLTHPEKRRHGPGENTLLSV